MQTIVKSTMICVLIAVLAGWGGAASIEDHDQPMQTPKSNMTLRPVSQQPAGPVIYLYPMRQLLLDTFERSTLAPWTSSGTTNWGMRDTTDTYGPQAPAVSGYRYAGHPSTDLPEYPSSGANPGLICYLTSPTIDLTGITELYLSFNYWGDFEGGATNFDGGIIEISADNGATWVQVDSQATGHLNPTYDSQLAGTGTLGTAWAYCYDTDPDWVSVSSQDLIALGYVSTGNQIRVRYTFASDALSGGQGWFIDDVRIADTPPPDLQPPIITHTPLPDTTDTLNNYTVSAIITDEGTGVNPDSVYLHYEIENGPIVDVDMVNTGGDTYEADIPSQNWHTDVWYSIHAADIAGNWTSTALYNFEVTNARLITYDDGQPYWIPGDLAPGNGLYVQFSFSDVGIDSGLVHKVIYYFDGPGPFDLKIYQGTGGNPGSLLGELLGLTSSGYEWISVDCDPLDIRTTGDVVAGFICGASGGDTTRVLMDPTQEYPQRMWGWITGAWQQTPYAGGDYMIRMKVIPIEPPGIEDRPTDHAFTLTQISPNPMRERATIEFQLFNSQKVKLNIYNVSGKLIRTLIDDVKEKGTHSLYWNGCDTRGNNVACGVYFVNLETDDCVMTKKLLLIK